MSMKGTDQLEDLDVDKKILKVY